MLGCLRRDRAEENRLHAFNKEEETGVWRELRDKEHHSYLGDRIKEDEMGWNVVRIDEVKNAYKILVENLKEEIHWRSGCRWEKNTRYEPEKNGVNKIDWIHLAQDRVKWRDFVKTAMDVSGSIKWRES
jgi:hypothetical protein